MRFQDLHEKNLQDSRDAWRELLRGVIFSAEQWAKPVDLSRVKKELYDVVYFSLMIWGEKLWEQHRPRKREHAAESVIQEYEFSQEALAGLVKHQRENVVRFLNRLKPWEDLEDGITWPAAVKTIMQRSFMSAFHHVVPEVLEDLWRKKRTNKAKEPEKKKGWFSRLFNDEEIEGEPVNEAKVHRHMDFDGLDLSIEVPAGGTRTGKNHKGERWERKVASSYGYIKGTHSPDGEHLDCWVRKNPKRGAKVYVVHQMTPDGSRFDEDKVMLGFSNKAEAERAFKAETYKPEKMYGGMSEFDIEHFKVVAYQASKSKAMLSSEKNYDKFKSKGYLKPGIKSPIQVARAVSESIQETDMDSNIYVGGIDSGLNRPVNPYSFVVLLMQSNGGMPARPIAVVASDVGQFEAMAIADNVSRDIEAEQYETGGRLFPEILPLDSFESMTDAGSLPRHYSFLKHYDNSKTEMPAHDQGLNNLRQLSGIKAAPPAPMTSLPTTGTFGIFRDLETQWDDGSDCGCDAQVVEPSEPEPAGFEEEEDPLAGMKRIW